MVIMSASLPPSQLVCFGLFLIYYPLASDNTSYLHSQRITIPEIKQHPWFSRNFPKELIEWERTRHQCNKPAQTEEIMQIIEEARRPAAISSSSLKPPLASGNAGDSDAWCWYRRCGNKRWFLGSRCLWRLGDSIVCAVNVKFKYYLLHGSIKLWSS